MEIVSSSKRDRRKTCYGFDFDDIFVKLTKYFWAYCRFELSYEDIPPLAEASSPSFDHILCRDSESCSYAFNRFVKHEMWHDMHLIPPPKRSVEVLRMLKEHGAELVIITAREHRFEEITRKYISSHFGDIFSDIVFCNLYGKEGKKESKAEACRRLGCVLLVDDNLSHIEEVERHGIEGVPFGGNSWTKRHDRHIESWDHLYEKLKAPLLKRKTETSRHHG